MWSVQFYLCVWIKKVPDRLAKAQTFDDAI